MSSVIWSLPLPVTDLKTGHYQGHIRTQVFGARSTGYEIKVPDAPKSTVLKTVLFGAPRPDLTLHSITLFSRRAPSHNVPDLQSCNVDETDDPRISKSVLALFRPQGDRRVDP
jgi:hypothetical protein